MSQRLQPLDVFLEPISLLLPNHIVIWRHDFWVVLPGETETTVLFLGE